DVTAQIAVDLRLHAKKPARRIELGDRVSLTPHRRQRGLERPRRTHRRDLPRRVRPKARRSTPTERERNHDERDDLPHGATSCTLDSKSSTALPIVLPYRWIYRK